MKGYSLYSLSLATFLNSWTCLLYILLLCSSNHNQFIFINCLLISPNSLLIFLYNFSAIKNSCVSCSNFSSRLFFYISATPLYTYINAYPTLSISDTISIFILMYSQYAFIKEVTSSLLLLNISSFATFAFCVCLSIIIAAIYCCKAIIAISKCLLQVLVVVKILYCCFLHCCLF